MRASICSRAGPRDTIVAHKTGTTAVVINDVGIITLPDNGGHLALAVFVMNDGRAAAMQKVISDLGAAVYESSRRAARLVNRRSARRS